MNIFNQIKILPNVLMNKFSSVLLASESDTFLTSLLSSDNILSRILRVFVQIMYFACKWVMYLVDVIYFYILQLAGISADTSIFDSAKSDMTFRMLIDNKDMVTQIIKNFIVIAIILILVTAIIAIIKQQAVAFKEKKARKNPSGDVIKSIFKSFLVIILTPLISILGIVASSVLLQSLFNATNLSQAKSLSARVFNASASAANKYRLYAESGVRIPIKYNFSDDDNKSKAINYTVQMIGNKKFPSLNYFDENQVFNSNEFNDPVLEDTVIKKGNSYNSATETWLEDVYYTYYDSSDNYNKNSLENKYKKYSTHVYEYYAMSDVVGYALDTMEPLYFMTIQELLESVKDNEERLRTMFASYHVRLLKADGSVIGGNGISYDAEINAIRTGTYSFIEYTSAYSKGTYTYVHVKDAIDEMEGAKFVIAYKVSTPSTYEQKLNGTYYLDGSEYIEADKYYYKASDKAKYVKVDLYYTYNASKEQYEKVPSVDKNNNPTVFDNAKEYYYKIGDEYRLISETDKTKFYYKNKNREYINITFGATDLFYDSILNYYYMPLVAGVAVGSNEVFSSNYIKTSNLITAKGLFDKSSYPTAIRRLGNGNIMFYRDDLELVTEGSVSDVGKLEQIEAESDSDEDSDDGKNIFQKVGSAVSSAFNSVKKFVTSLFNPLKLVPDLKIDESKVSLTYTNKTSSVFELTDGELHISYFFADSLTSKLSSKMYGMDLNCLFDSLSINYVILVMGSVIFLKICITSVFGLINRALNLFIMILIYPVACATIPLDEVNKASKSGSYAKWSQKYTQLLFSTYGLILSLNIVFIIIPVIDKLVFFTPENLQSNRALGRIANAIYNPWTIINLGGFKFEPNYALISTYINKILRIIFEIAAFSVIAPVDGKDKSETFYSAIQAVIGTGPGALEDSPLDAVKKTLKTMSNAFNMVFFPNKAVKNVIEKSKETLKTAKENLPGSAIAKDLMTKYDNMRTAQNQEKTKEDLKKAIKANAPKEEVEKKLEEYKKAYNIK